MGDKLGKGRVSFGMNRRQFIGSALAASAATWASGCGGFGARHASRPVKFLFMTDMHVEADFEEHGHACFPMWKAGNHAALRRTFQFINEDSFCRDAAFALFGGDQLNTGYDYRPWDMDTELRIYNDALLHLDLHRTTRNSDLSDLNFRFMPTFTTNRRNFRHPDLSSRVIAIQGNHDTGVSDFYRDCAFQSGPVRFICFFASYIGLPAAPGKYRSTGGISDETIAFIEREMELAAKDPAIRHIVLVSHWSIVTGNPDFKLPILDACKENRFNANRGRLLALAEKYGCSLYISGHEHNGAFPVGQAGPLTDISCGTVTGTKGSWSVVEIDDDRAVFNVYSRADATGPEDAELESEVVFTRLPQRLFTREISLTPKKGVA